MTFMNYAFIILAAFSLSCNKTHTAMPIKSNPSATFIGLTVLGRAISLDASKSIGDISQYGWALDISSPTDVSSTNQLGFSPNSSHKGGYFITVTATVRKAGTYVFGLTVYDKNGGNDYSTVKVDVQ